MGAAEGCLPDPKKVLKTDSPKQPPKLARRESSWMLLRDLAGSSLGYHPGELWGGTPGREGRYPGGLVKTPMRLKTQCAVS